MTSCFRCACSAVLLLAVVGCTDTPSTPNPVPVEPRVILQTVAGDNQSGEAGATLDFPLRVRVVDGESRAVPGITVQWSTNAPDVVEPTVSVTDANGETETRWTPRSTGTQRRATARTEFGEVHFHALVTAAPPQGIVTLVELETFDGSGEVVHPDVVETRWNGGAPTRFLAITPYPNGNATLENPSVYAGGGADDSWHVPEGGANPVAVPTAGHLSDPDLVDDADNRELRLYYRAAGNGNTLLVTTSRDALTWTTPRALLTTPDHDLVSPAIVRRSANQWEMWSVNSGSSGCYAHGTQVERRTSTDGYTWSSPTVVTMGAENHQVWHLDVQYVAALAQYVAVYSVKTRTDCSTAAMFVATSADGVTWQPRSVPLLVRGVIPAFDHIVYRSTFLFNAARDEFTFWHSGATYGAGRWRWRMATERRSRRDVLEPVLGAVVVKARRVPEAPLLRIAP